LLPFRFVLGTEGMRQERTLLCAARCQRLEPASVADP
jgi:hypothetical protein